MSLEEGYRLPAIDEGSDLYTELCRIEYCGSVPADHRLNPLSAHFELHIEQGPQLELEDKSIGVVSSIQGNRRLQVSIRGKQAHAGSTPMALRADALVAPSRTILSIEETGYRHGGLATVGIIACENGSINCVPGLVNFSIDLRHPKKMSLDNMEQDIREKIRSTMRDTIGLSFDLSILWESPAATFCDIALSCVRASAHERHGKSQVMELQSLAGHDSAMTSLCVPTAMIFVPSKNGVSHAPEEYTSELQWQVSPTDRSGNL